MKLRQFRCFTSCRKVVGYLRRSSDGLRGGAGSVLQSRSSENIVQPASQLLRRFLEYLEKEIENSKNNTPIMVDVLSGKVYLIITGASRGIGAEIAQQFSRLLAQGSRILLLARDGEKLKKNAENMPKHIAVDCESVDLGVATKEELRGIIEKSLGPGGAKNYEKAVIIHNAGTIGDLSKRTIDMDDLDEWRKYFDLNLFSPIILNSVFMKIFTDETKIARLVVNVTSLCAIEPMKSSAFYNTGKAAREMFFKTFAAEFPGVNVLNWSPGPVDTDMFDTLTKKSGDLELRAKFNELRDKKEILTTEQSTNRLILVLKQQDYKSGDHVDYYDQL